MSNIAVVYFSDILHRKSPVLIKLFVNIVSNISVKVSFNAHLCILAWSILWVNDFSY